MFANRRLGVRTDSGLGIGAAWADYDNDGFLDLYVANNFRQNNFLYRNNGDGTMTQITSGPAVNSGGYSHGCTWADFDGDGDGDADLFVAGGEVNADQHFLNNGGGTFARVTEGALVHDGGRSSGGAWADYDNDGDLDLFVANGIDFGGGTPPPEPGFLYRNDGGTNHWLILRLVGVASNRSAIGAKVRVLATIHGKTFWQLREVSGGAGYLSQDDLRVHFGLGDAESVETVFIEWPSGVTQVLKNVAANQHRDVMEEPVPSIAFSFSEGSGDTTRNYGDEAGSGEITRTDGYPVFRPNVPNGPWAPPNNVAAMEFPAVSPHDGRMRKDNQQGHSNIRCHAAPCCTSQRMSSRSSSLTGR